MATITAERPQFFEGQYLGADDLAAIVDYLRTSNARQNLGQHSWGVAIGLQLVSQPISDTAVEYYVQPGVAVDGYGRIIVVNNPTRIEADQFLSLSTGDIDVWIRYDESDFSATRPGFNVCSATDEYARVSESFKIEVGNKTSILDRQSGITVNDTFITDARDALISVDPDERLLCDASVPHQLFPIDDDVSNWLVPLGHVKWQASSNTFLPLVDPAKVAQLETSPGTITPDQVYESLMLSRTKRRLIGVVAESVLAADDLIRLRERTAEPDPAAGNDAVCNKLKVQSADLHFCDGRLKPKELVWLEGHTRVRGDIRLLNGRLEFRDKNGRDYIERKTSSGLVSAITPALLQRDDDNAKHGTDLQVLLGKSEEGINRFTIGSIEFSGDDLCELDINPENRVVIQDNGMVGIGTTNPDSILESPYSVRGLEQEVIENEGTEDENKYNIYRLESYENTGGVIQWQMDLWDTTGTDRKSLNFTEHSLAKTRLFLQAGGNIGVGTTEPVELLHIYSNEPALFIDINGSSGLSEAAVKFGKDADDHARIYWSKDTDKLYIRHHSNDAIAVSDDKVGIGTDTPQTKLHIKGGKDVDLDDDGGYLLLGDIDDLNIAIDDNEIQARSNGDISVLHLQAEGGDLHVHRWVSGAEVIVKENGNVGIGTASPVEKLDVRGDIKLGSSGNLFAMAGVENLRTIVGRVNANGTIAQGDGFSVDKGSAGIYTLEFDSAFSSHPVVVASMYNEDEHIVSVRNVTSSECEIRSRDMFGSNAGDLQNAAFTFIAIGER